MQSNQYALHSSLLNHRATHLILEGYWDSWAQFALVKSMLDFPSHHLLLHVPIPWLPGGFTL